MIDQRQRRLRTPARDRDEALAIFGKELRLKLTLEEPMSFVVYLLNESESDTHLLVSVRNHLVSCESFVIQER
jgi:hypothetical protein